MPRAKRRSRQAADVDAVCRSIVRRLSEARADQGIPMASLADALGCTPEHLERRETARVPLTMTMLIEWARALRLNIVIHPESGQAAPTARPPIGPALRRGRPLAGPPRQLPLLNEEQVEQLRRSPVPPTGNKLLTALKLSDATIADLSRAATLRYVRLANWVGGRVRTVPSPYAAHLATCFGCEPHDLFPDTANDDAAV